LVTTVYIVTVLVFNTVILKMVIDHTSNRVCFC